MRLFGFSKEKFYAIAIGKFGVLHLGHQELITLTFQASQAKNLTPAIFSFSPSPALFFLKDRQKYGRIFSFKFIYKLIKHHFNQDFALLIANFNQNFASKTPADFIDFLYNKLNVRHITVGENFYFGKNRSGTLQTLIELCNQKGISLQICKLTTEESSPISTTHLRNLLQEGNIARFNSLTAFKTCYQIDGKVQKGMGVAGKILGFKTANISLKSSLILPKFGVYKCKVLLKNEAFLGIVNIGIKPTISNEKIPLAEVHILNFNSDIYGERLTLELIDFIREERKFPSLEALKEQISKDIN
jgi:riboflavin kinase/FMN adenylyltransferase